MYQDDVLSQKVLTLIQRNDIEEKKNDNILNIIKRYNTKFHSHQPFITSFHIKGSLRLRGKPTGYVRVKAIYICLSSENVDV